MALLWRSVAILALFLAGVVTALPLLPALPFVLLAAAAATRGWPWLADRLRRRPTLGPVIVAWQERGALPPEIKAGSALGLGVSTALAWTVRMPSWTAIVLTVILGGIAAWHWRRPES